MNDNNLYQPFIPKTTGIADFEGESININMNPSSETYNWLMPVSNELGCLKKQRNWCFNVERHRKW